MKIKFVLVNDTSGVLDTVERDVDVEQETDQALTEAMVSVIEAQRWSLMPGDSIRIVADEDAELAPTETRAKPVDLFDPEDNADQLACMREAAGDRPVDNEEEAA
jgi:hypothetical protein